MRQEIDLWGVFVPALLVWAIAAYAATAVMTRLLARSGFYRFVWHRALFDLALFVVVWGGFAALGGRGAPAGG